MTTPDRRRWPCNGRAAAARLRGQAEAERFVVPEPRSLAVALADLRNAPDGRRERQVVHGDPLDVIEDRDGWAFVESRKDGYTGYLPSAALGPATRPTHRVTAAASHVYAAADIKSPDLMPLTLGATVEVLETGPKFARIAAGYLPATHLGPLGQTGSDPVAVAERLIGTPYLWGGNSHAGIDCSGLVQAACLSCGIPCPGDSDMQERELGTALPADAALRRGDLIFWKGHVAWVADETRILHANAFHMAVAYEDREAAIARIALQGDGPVTARKRLPG
ncbi:NLP/P60 hydrolase [Pseudooceanicola sp. 216_PA32_1]|uniref:NLP/P60 hydrolase n=1 Tax=Pseudooceanicola pacificus TaxID=2676438 RepID=A0A844WA37_9RHOB|nr:NlpC/P60 family protein [Pseudooceanicola pacificus]MWB76502.1 NLP/P60 hydrolase [Pseudooceanicola pacificus]